MKTYAGIDIREFTELSHQDQDRVLSFCDRFLNRPVNDTIDDLRVVLEQARLFRMISRKPVSAPPSPTHIKHVTSHDDIEAPASN